MNGWLASPLRNLTAGILYMLGVSCIASIAYRLCGWSWSDAAYMVTMTITTVGFGEVHPIVTPPLRLITIGLMVFGCTGMIFVTGSLVQLISASQFQVLLGNRRMQKNINLLTRHVIICGFGRIGQFLAQELRRTNTGFVVIERDESRLAAAREAGYLCLVADATDEETLFLAGISRAKGLATVLPDDAANVFITLSARGLNKDLMIIARGESPQTETKLLRAGANRVVLPAHIGAERIAEIFLFQDMSAMIERGAKNSQITQDLRSLGFNMETWVIAAHSPVAGQTIAAIERLGQGGFMVVALHLAKGEVLLQPPPEIVAEAGDGLALLERPGRTEAIQALFAPVKA